METETISSPYLPPGFRFHPSDEELIVHYLMKKLTSRPLPAAVVAEVELYSYNPWDLHRKALFGEDEWYFFTPRDRKYPNGERPNRTAASGYWKATGTDKTILSASGSRSIGVKKALVFYKGRPPKGLKTEWIMTEYRLPDAMTRPSRSRGSMRLDDWVLCRIRQKGNMSKNTWAVKDSPSTLVDFMPKIEELPSAYKEANGDITTGKLLQNCPTWDSMLTCQDLPPIETISNATFPQKSNSKNSGSAFDDQTSGKANNFMTNPFFEDCLNPTKEKLNETERFDNIIGSNKITDGNRNEVAFLGNMMTANAMNFYNQYQAQGNIFNLSQSDAIMTLLHSREDF